jgi:formiminotetrahydrofolate cyclodeaminase
MSRRKLQVEPGEILEAMTRSNSDPASHFLDLQQGRVVVWDTQLDLDHDDEIANAIEADPSRYVAIPRCERRSPEEAPLDRVESWLSALGIEPSFRPRPQQAVADLDAIPSPLSGATPERGESAAPLGAQAERSLAERSRGEVIRAVAAAGVAPGAGAAGAITLALAGACAAKAVAVTLRHRPADAALRALAEQLADISRRALIGADEDTRRFEAFIHSKDAADASRLIRNGEALTQLAARLGELLRVVEQRVDPSVQGDASAAAALCSAFRAIASENLKENRKSAASARE